MNMNMANDNTTVSNNDNGNENDQTENDITITDFNRLNATINNNQNSEYDVNIKQQQQKQQNPAAAAAASMTIKNATTTNKTPPVRFGHELRKNFYDMYDDVVYLNHGSYGLVPAIIAKRRVDLIRTQDRSPDSWFRYEAPIRWKQNINALRKYLKLDDDEENSSSLLLLCQNATDALNSIIKSLDFELDDIQEEVILACQYSYKSVLYTLDYISKYRLINDDPPSSNSSSKKIKIFQVPCTYPISSKKQILNEFERMCEYLIKEKFYRIRLVVIDHISSDTATLFPVGEIIQLIRKWTNSSSKTFILVDGSHAIGQVPIDLRRESIDCDAYVSNLHKWFLAPRGCSFLYVRNKAWALKHLQPNVISNSYHREPMENFFYRATSDMSHYFLVNDCIKLHTNYLGGLASISNYITRLLDEASEMLARAWQTNKLEMTHEIEAPFMRLVRMPKLKCSESDESFRIHEDMSKLEQEQLCFRLVKQLFYLYKVDTFVSIIQNHCYCRLSGYIYNEMSDYVRLKDAVLDLCQKEKLDSDLESWEMLSESDTVPANV